MSADDDRLCQRPCLRTSCTRRCAGCQFHDGEHRCLGHAREVALRRQATVTRGVQRAAREVMKTWPRGNTPPPKPAPPTPPHEDPIIQKIVLDGHGPIGVYAKNQAGTLTAGDVAESYRIAKGAELVFSVQKNRDGGQSFRQGLIAAEEVLNRQVQGNRASTRTIEVKNAVETVLGTAIRELGILCVEDNKDEMRKGLPLYDSDRPTLELANLVEPVAQRLFQERKYSEEMAVRGLLVRSTRLIETERALKSANQRIADLDKKVREVEERARKLRSDELILRTQWASKDGRKMMSADFDDPHLLNTIRFIERGFLEDMERWKKTQEFNEDEWPEDCMYAPVPELPPIYATLVAEARQRKLLKASDRLTVTETP